MLEFSWKTLWIFLFISIVGIQARYDGEWWGGSDDQELEDEKRDAEILKAVQTSVAEWEARKNSRSRYKRAEYNICYPELGCFGSSGTFSYLDTLPSPPEEISTTFLLYPGRRTTRSITLGDSPLVEVPFNNITDAYDWAKKHFNASRPTKVLVHGFGSSCHYVWVYEMRSALMSVDDFNIVCVDWENGATLPNYVKASANARLVGKQLAMLLKGLEEKVGLSRKNMHLIGFSLGAHVAGFAGSEMKNISRITGLDPAGPLFETQVPDARLDSSDAKFVDVIHSNGENLFLGGLGSWQPMGHVDFYPNGGRMQKGCSNLFVGAVTDFIWAGDTEGRSLCNHRRAYKFFVDSVSPRCHFPAFPCESYDAFLAGKCTPCTPDKPCGNMGYYADKAIGRGQLFLITRDEEPFCAHQYSVKIESSQMMKPLINYGKITMTLVGDSDLNETFTMTSKDDEQLLPGEVISRIVVPHPIISEPNKVQIFYQGYSGWLSSGFKRWKIDKVSMMDSFGKTSSVCKKGLELESGIPVMLRLYPGNCNIPKDGQNIDKNSYLEDRISEDSSTLESDVINSTTVYPPGFEHTDNNRKFIPTPVIRIGNEAIKEGGVKAILKEEGFISVDHQKQHEVFVPWKVYGSFQLPKEGNGLDDSAEVESNRAFNTKSVKSVDGNLKELDSELKEIVEPILRKPSNKNARAHDLNKPEITEPILGPTTVRNIATTTEKPNLISRLLMGEEKEINYNFYDTNNNDWVPSSRKTVDNKFKRHDASQTITLQSPGRVLQSPEKPEKSNNPIRMIMMTVQFLPQRLTRMFEQAERYARETIFPLITQHTPKFISNFISPRDRQQPQYVPLEYDETATKNQIKRVSRTEFTPPDIAVPLSRTDSEDNSTSDNSNNEHKSEDNLAEARSTFLSKMDENKADTLSESSTIDFSKIPPDSKVYYATEITERLSTSTETASVSTEENISASRRIYIDLPVFDERDIGVKYIPLQFPDKIASEQITKK